MYCHSCGNKNLEREKFCAACGIELRRGLDSPGGATRASTPGPDAFTEIVPAVPLAQEAPASTRVQSDAHSTKRTGVTEALLEPFGYYLLVWKKFADFRGRSRRKEYWHFFILNSFASVALSVYESMYGLWSNVDFYVLSTLYQWVAVLPGLAVGVRRLHDTNRSGWFLLLPFVNLYFLVKDSQPEANRFGTNPKTT